MKIIITDHARKRLKNRMGVSDKKMEKTVLKAWRSKDIAFPKLKKIEYKAQFHRKNRVAKTLMGYVFVFALDKNDIVLVTII